MFDEPSADRGPAGHGRAFPRFSRWTLKSIKRSPLHSRQRACPASTAYETSRVDDEDWVRQAQSQFSPQQITPQLWVVPSWHAAPDPRAINIVLDPGLAFGTGAHPTTRLCLRWLAAHIRRGVSVIDYGCGSGILAIAALKLGAAHRESISTRKPWRRRGATLTPIASMRASWARPKRWKDRRKSWSRTSSRGR